jgi:hypothetical protein
MHELETSGGARPLSRTSSPGVRLGGRHLPTSCVGGDDGCSLAVSVAAYCGPREDETQMLRTTPVSLAARERLRNHQAAAAKAIAVYSASLSRLDTAISRRAKVAAEQDALVAAANAEVAAAVVGAAKAMGADLAASMLDLTKAEVRRMTKDTG